MPVRLSTVVLQIGAIVLAQPVFAQSATPPSTDVYVPATAIERPAAEYPAIALAAERQGWIEINFVISKAGQAVDPIIRNSNGNAVLEDAALAALRRWRYEPATLNGEPVEEAASTWITFWARDEPTNAARSVFQRRYQALVDALDRGDLSAADKRLRDLKSLDFANPYEDAWFWFANYYFLETTNSSDIEERLQSLERAINRDRDYLEPDLLVSAGQRLYVLHGQKLDLGAAVRTYERLRDSPVARSSEHYQATLSAMTPSYQRILTAIDGDQMFSMNAAIGERGFFEHRLLRRSFSLADVSGRVELIQVRCERAVERHVPMADKSVWTAPPGRGKCTVLLKGDAGTTFQFEEYPLSHGGVAAVE
jgi:TonB family protein